MTSEQHRKSTAGKGEQPKEHSLPDKMPNFMEGPRGRGLEKLDQDDFAWMGDKGKMSDEKHNWLIDQTFGPPAALREIVTAIIQYHRSKENEAIEGRLENAMLALMGAETLADGHKKIGRKETRSDDPILRDIAREYLIDALSPNKAERDFTDLYRKAAQTFESDFLNWTEEKRNHRIRQLRKKFERIKDRFLVPISGTETTESVRYRTHGRAHIDTILKSLRALGIIGTPKS